MEKVKDVWIDVKYAIEDHPFVAWLMIGVVVVFIGVFGFNMLGSDGNDETDLGEIAQEEVQEGGEESLNAYNELIGVQEETLHILTNPDQYTDEVVDRAYHESLITFDNKFVEDNTYIGAELESGIYLYHEKAHDDFAEVANLALEVNNLGVPVNFYTPQLDQSIASLSNHTQVLDKGKVNVYAVVVREGEVDEKITTIEGVISYLGGVIDANTD